MTQSDPTWMQDMDETDRRELEYARLHDSMEKQPPSAVGDAYRVIAKLTKKLDRQSKAQAKKSARSAGSAGTETDAAWMTSLADDRYRKMVHRAQDYALDPFGEPGHVANLTIAALADKLDEYEETIARLKGKAK